MQPLLIILVLLLSSPAVAAADQRMVDSGADSLVGLLVDTDAVEYRKARQVHYVKGRGGLALVFFTIEGFHGGNNYTFYLAVFEPSWTFDPSRGEAQQHTEANIAKYRLVGYSPIGGKAWRFVDFSKFTIDKRHIILHTREYARNDAMCCPSKPGTAVYEMEDRRLIEVKPN